MTTAGAGLVQLSALGRRPAGPRCYFMCSRCCAPTAPLALSLSCLVLFSLSLYFRAVSLCSLSPTVFPLFLRTWRFFCAVRLGRSKLEERKKEDNPWNAAPFASSLLFPSLRACLPFLFLQRFSFMWLTSQPSSIPKMLCCPVAETTQTQCV